MSLLRHLPHLILACLLASACQSGGVSFRNAKLTASDPIPIAVDGLLSRPKGKRRFPAVVILQHCGGMTENVAVDWPHFLNSLGYVVLTVDSFGARGYRNCRETPNYLLARVEMIKDAYGALDYLIGQPFVDANRIAVIGFSIGALAINSTLIPWRVRAEGGREFRAAIAFYGPCQNLGDYTKASMPLMEIVGEKDRHIAPSCRAAKTYAPELEVHILAEAHHAFDSRSASGKSDVGGNYMEYNAEATAQARELVRDFLARHLK